MFMAADGGDEESVERAPSIGEGLHRRVPPQRWCVTCRDLKQFRFLVTESVRNNRIKPTVRDPFDTSDTYIGPNMYTVNDQFIKPVTQNAGQASWALMLHPEGLECDLYVTHCWLEGVYEFIDKVCQSWPRKARHAYCCMLSNPQNLDIGKLLDSPKDSPFAQALNACTYMLVVPNERASIYSRVWCAYEAYLGYSGSKTIYTAWRPSPDFRSSMRGTMLYMSTLAVVSATPALIIGIDSEGTYRRGAALFRLVHDASLFLVFPTLMLTNMVRNPRSARCVVCIGAGSSAVFFGVHSHICWARIITFGIFGPHSLDHLVGWLLAIGLCCAAIVAEMDRLRCVDFYRETEQLANGYTGKLRDATASMERDKERIMAEVLGSGMEDNVDSAIQVLLDAGMSTPELRLAVACGAGRMKQAGYVPWAMVVLALLFWIGVPIGHVSFVVEQHQAYRLEGDCSCDGCSFSRLAGGCIPPLLRPELWISLLGILGAILWLCFFLRQGLDKRGFAAAVLVRCVIWIGFPGFAGTAFGGITAHENFVAHLNLQAVVAPTIWMLTAAGPGRVSKIPCVGPRLVKFFMKRFTCNTTWC